jgi:hypothetical protein
MSQGIEKSLTRRGPLTSARTKAAALVLGLGLASAGVWSATPVAPKALEAAIAAPVTAPGPGRVAGEGYADVVAKVTPAVVNRKPRRNLPSCRSFPRARRSAISSVSAVAADGSCRRSCSAVSALV